MTAPFQALVPRDLVVVAGPDATSFLQSLVSQDLEPIAVGESAQSLLLQPQGKLIANFAILHAAPDEWWCVVEPGFGGALADGLRRFKIRVKVEITQRSVTALAVRGVSPEVMPSAFAIAAEWGDSPAFDVLGDDVEPVAIDGVPVVDAGAYERARIEAGVPRLGDDVDERTIPQEAGLEEHAVSFTKGCFVGQELVCRIDSRGHVNRVLRRLRAEAPLVRGAAVRAGDKDVGEVTSAAGEVGLAMLRREVEAGTTVDAGGVSALVEVR